MLHKNQDIGFFFNPKSIAIVGASPTLGKISYVILESLRKIGFQGDIYPVNPKYKSIADLKYYGSVSEIEKNIDIAVIAVPAAFVLDALRDAAKLAKGAIIISAGFGEAGNNGRKLEDGIKEVVKERAIRVIGPNCLGIYDTISKVDTYFVPAERMGRPGRGGISILSQSGSFASIIMDELVSEGIGVSRVVSYGNRVDVGESDCLEFLAEDDDTKAVAIYMESVDDGRRFVEAAARCAKKKPVLAIKVGRREAGISAAKSHTGAMTGRYEIYRAAFRKAGIIEIDGYEGLKDACRALNIFKPVKGRKVLIITDGGGIGVRIADACEDMGLEVANLTGPAQKNLAAIFPAYYSIINPIDLTGSVADEEYITALEEGLKGGFDMAVVAVLWGPPMLTKGLVDRLTEAIKRGGKPVLICSPGGTFTKMMNRVFEEKGIPVFASPESAARAAAILSSKIGVGSQKSEVGQVTKIKNLEIETIIKSVLTSERKALLEPDAKSLISAYGIDVPKSLFVKDENEVGSALEKLSLPVVMKVVSPEILHKSDVGGVATGLKNSADVSRAIKEISKSIAEKAPMARIDGFLLEETAPRGVEVIIGGLRDSQFGPAVMFGIGGIAVELLKDVSYRLAPVDKAEALEMMNEVKSYPLLTGFRGSRPVELDKLADAIVKVSEIITELEEIKEIEINPLIVSESGAMAVDARVLFDKAG